jgi:hypothetical protein
LETPVDFVRDVKPILEASCFGCHSGATPKSQLRLDSAAGAMKSVVSVDRRLSPATAKPAASFIVSRAAVMRSRCRSAARLFEANRLRR